MELSSTLGALHEAVTTTVTTLTESDSVGRIWDGDHTLWSPDPAEIADRLGWLQLLDEMDGAVSEMEMFAAGVRADGIEQAVICGMGGSSLFPEVLARTFADNEGLPLAILDTTDPAAIDRILSDRRITDTLFVAASKSGTTVETTSQLETFWSRLQRGTQFTVITDPGSALIDAADQRGFRRVFQNRSDIGGRFSALSYFGLLPGALAGAPIARILQSAREMVPALHGPEDSNPGVLLGTAMAVASRHGRDKATILIDPKAHHLGVWLEQLIAESTGKHGEGIVPIVDEPPNAAAYGEDRLFIVIGDAPGTDQIPPDAPVIRIPLTEATDIGAQVLLWEFATAVAGAVLGINPFISRTSPPPRRRPTRYWPTPADHCAGPDALTARGGPAGDVLTVCASVDPVESPRSGSDARSMNSAPDSGSPRPSGSDPDICIRPDSSTRGSHTVSWRSRSWARTAPTSPSPVSPSPSANSRSHRLRGTIGALQDAGARVGRVAPTEFLDA